MGAGAEDSEIAFLEGNNPEYDTDPPLAQHPTSINGRFGVIVAGQYLELFARERRPGWTCFGDESCKFGAGS